MCRVMTQVTPPDTPDELGNIEIAAQVSKIDRPLDEFDQRPAPRAFQFQNLVPDTPLDVIELEQTSRDRTSSRQPGPLRPSKPIANQRPQPRQTFGGRHGWPDDMLRGELSRMRQ